VAVQLALPMGWTESPPYFCAVTETIADLANQRLPKYRKVRHHHLDRLVDSKPPAARTSAAPQLSPPTSVDLPSYWNPNLPHCMCCLLDTIDVSVDDFIGAAQGTQRRLKKIRQVLMHSMLRPLDGNNEDHTREPISVKKLKQGDTL
jgi:hypothetical protein